MPTPMTQPAKANRTDRTPPTRRAIALTAAIAGIVLSASGCGAGSPSAGAGRSAETFTAAAFRYSGCMRRHGLSSFPSPATTDHDGQPVAYLAPTNALVASPAFKLANKDCQQILPILGHTQNIDAQAARERRLLAFATCMRGQHVSGFPDPTAQGQLTKQMITSAGVELRAPAVFAAAKTCLPSAQGAITAQQVERALSGGG
jgi:hypothetical protein